MRNPLLFPLLAISCGVALDRYVPFTSVELVAILAAFLLIRVMAGLCTERTARLSGFLGVVFLGVALAEARRPAPAPDLNAESGETLLLEGCVITPPALSALREQFVLELAPGAHARVTVWLKEDDTAPRLVYGQRIRAIARVRKPRNFRNPGAFDFAGYLARSSVYWTASASGSAAITILPGRCGSAWAAPLYAMRTAALDRLDRLYAGDAYASAMMRALVLGEASQVEKVWTEHFRRTGTYHAIVVSGLHVTLVAGVLLFFWRLLNLRRETGMIFAALAGWLYVLLCGYQAPALRAAAGFTLFTTATLFYRRGRILNLLAAVALVFLICDPSQLFEASFQLSFLSVAAIGAIALPILEQTTGVDRGLADTDRDLYMPPRLAQFRVELRLIAETAAIWARIPAEWCVALMGAALRVSMWIYGMLAVSGAVQLGLMLPMIAYFHRVSITGLSANLVVVPLLSLAVPFALTAIVTGWTWAAVCAAWLLNLSRKAVECHVAWEPLWRIPDPPLWAGLCFACALIAVILLPGRLRLVLPALAATAVLLCWPSETARADKGTLELTVIDVGQGDSLLAGFPDGKWMLIDAGGIPAFRGRPKPRLDIGEDVVSPYLWSRGIRYLDILVCTHSHEDHAGGLTAIRENFQPREVWGGANVPGATRPRAPFQMHFGQATIDVLAPTLNYAAGEMPRNDDSLVLRLRYGNHTFLLTGDVERRIEEDLLESGALAKVDVLKVAHHGSKTSSTDEFLSVTRPAIAVISAGDGNVYRHPHSDVLRRLENSHSIVLRTDRDGLITIRSDGKRLDAQTWKWRQDRRHIPAVFSPVF